MAPCKRQLNTKRHLVCNDCQSLVDFALSGCTKHWAETREDGSTFRCRGCSRVECLMKEVYRLTAVVKEMEEKLNTKTDNIENDDRERVGNTVTQKEQICETEKQVGGRRVRDTSGEPVADNTDDEQQLREGRATQTQ